MPDLCTWIQVQEVSCQSAREMWDTPCGEGRCWDQRMTWLPAQCPEQKPLALDTQVYPLGGEMPSGKVRGHGHLVEGSRAHVVTERLVPPRPPRTPGTESCAQPTVNKESSRAGIQTDPDPGTLSPLRPLRPPACKQPPTLSPSCCQPLNPSTGKGRR